MLLQVFIGPVDKTNNLKRSWNEEWQKCVKSYEVHII